jgi:uncharacterized membrane protein (DUF4010 family)
MQFALVTLVVLPVLPDRAYGPYEALNPYQIWLMVVLIVGISLVGYVAHKLLGERQAPYSAAWSAACVSTATTVAFARRTAESARERRAGRARDRDRFRHGLPAGHGPDRGRGAGQSRRCCRRSA